MNTYLGGDSIEPFLQACRLHGADLLPRPHVERLRASDVQGLTLGRPTGLAAGGGAGRGVGADLVGDRGLSSVGAVVGATVPRAVATANGCRGQVLLLPGVGAQGAGSADVARAFTSGPASALVFAARSVIYAYRGGSEGSGVRLRPPRRPGCAQTSGRSPAGDARQPRVARWLAPAAFFAAATIRDPDRPPGLSNDDEAAPPPAAATTTAPPATTTRTQATRPATTAPAPAAEFYVIEAGDTLAVIADRYETTVEELLVLNPDIDRLAHDRAADPREVEGRRLT